MRSAGDRGKEVESAMRRKKTWLFVSVVVALVLSVAGVALAQQQAEPPDKRQQQAQQQE